MVRWKKKLLYAGCALTLVSSALLVAFTAGSVPSHLNAAAVAAAPPAGPDLTSPEVQEARRSAQGLSTVFRAVSQRVLPAVVAIENVPKARKVEIQRPSPRQGSNPFEGTPFEDFFKDSPLGRDFRFEVPRNAPRGRGLGSGVIIDPSGLIMTNNHVVQGGGDVKVRLHDGREFKAVDVWTDPKTDIAIVKIDASNLSAAAIGNSDTVEIGDWVLALGQPFGLESTVTAGIISAKHRGIGITDRENFLQTDAAINPGNSGGPLVNLDGEVVGINTAISSRSGGSDGIGFAVPINLAQWVGDQLAKGGVVHRAYLGVGIQPLTASLAEQFQVPPRVGVVVTQVFPESPAAEAGLREGDVIVEFNGARIASPQELQLRVERTKLGQHHPLVVIRDGKRVTLKFTSKEQPSDFGSPERLVKRSEEQDGASLNKLGVEVNELSGQVAKELGLPDAKGVVVTHVEPGSLAAEVGLKSGDVITQVNRKPVRSLDDFTARVDEDQLREGVLLLVRNESGSRFVVVKS